MLPTLVLLTVLLVIVFLIGKSMVDAQRARSGGTTASSSPSAEVRRLPRGRRKADKPKPRKPEPLLDKEELAAHVDKLKHAVRNDLISVEEAVDSVVRQTDGAMSRETARRLFESKG